MAFLSGYGAFLDYRYWLNPYPIPLGPSLVAQIFAFFAFFVVAGIALAVAARTLRKKDELLSDLLHRFSGPLGWTGSLGLLLLFFTYEQSPFLGMRFWFLILTVFFFYRLARAVFYAVKDFPGKRAEAMTKHDFERWLPQPHKH